MSKNLEDSQPQIRPSTKAKHLTARLQAVQALYQSMQNKQLLRAVLEEYLQHRSTMEVDGQSLVSPDGALLTKILLGLEERRPEVTAIIEANLNKQEGDRPLEPLLSAILMCGCFEILIKSADIPIIINDYLNVTHSFYAQGEVALVNGILDNIAKLLHSA